MNTHVKGIAIATTALWLSACTAIGGSGQGAVPTSQIKDAMTAEEFREYGKTSPTTV